MSKLLNRLLTFHPVTSGLTSNNLYCNYSGKNKEEILEEIREMREIQKIFRKAGSGELPPEEQEDMLRRLDHKLMLAEKQITKLENEDDE